MQNSQYLAMQYISMSEMDISYSLLVNDIHIALSAQKAEMYDICRRNLPGLQY